MFRHNHTKELVSLKSECVQYYSHDVVKSEVNITEKKAKITNECLSLNTESIGNSKRTDSK